MDVVLYYIRDHLSGTHYFIYSLFLWIFLFSIVGYLFKQKYIKQSIILNTTQGENAKDEVKDAKKEKKKKSSKVETISNSQSQKVVDLNESSIKDQSNSSIDQELLDKKILKSESQSEPIPTPNVISSESLIATPMPNIESSESATLEPIKDNQSSVKDGPIPEIKI